MPNIKINTDLIPLVTQSSDGLMNQIDKTKLDKLGIYSTSEVDTGKIWIDGKHIYSILLNSTCHNLNTLISSLGISTFINGYGKAKSDYSNYWRIPTFYLAESGYNINLNVDGTISWGGFYNSGSCWYYLEYTKI